MDTPSLMVVGIAGVSALATLTTLVIFARRATQR